MSKVIMEFDSEEDKKKINAIVNLDKIQYSLSKLVDLRCEIVNNKFYSNELIYIKDNKIISNSDIENSISEDLYENSKEYLDKEYLERKLADILESIYDYIEY